MSRPPAVPVRSWSTCRRTCSSPFGTYHPPRKSDVHYLLFAAGEGDAAQIRKAVARLMASARRP